MTTIHSVKNQYHGINAHSHSFWQHTNRWSRFHNFHIGRLMSLLKLQLLPMGYIAEMEESLQIRRLGETRKPIADIIIGDLDPARAAQGFRSSTATHEMTVEELLVEDTEKPYFAVAIYELSEDLQIGEPVAWLELLSPTNKGSGDDAQAYIGKRRNLLDSGLVFVELDYLHETPPTFEPLADYTRREPGAHPYRIAILDPRPDLKTGPASIHEFDVDMPIPTVEIPLNNGDVLEFDFDAAYQKTYEEGVYGYTLDYRHLPLNFERYSLADQTRIARRMVAVIEAARSGTNLDSAPFPAPEISLEEALAQLSRYTD